jgi:FkbM family methyltransferase
VTSLRVRVANRFPGLGDCWRTLRAWRDRAALPRATYAEFGEDEWVARALDGLDLAGAIYVDVGAFHPTSLSNTYLFYRRGRRGVVVEPNPQLWALHRRIRPEDVAVCAACGSRAAVAELYRFSTPADASVVAARVDHNVSRKHLRPLPSFHVPVLPLDTILEAVPHDWIFLLSVDTEGFDTEVLRGASRALERSLYACVEVLSAEAERSVSEVLAPRGFRLVHRTSRNRLFENPAVRTRRSEEPKV